MDVGKRKHSTATDLTHTKEKTALTISVMPWASDLTALRLAPPPRWLMPPMWLFIFMPMLALKPALPPPMPGRPAGEPLEKLAMPGLFAPLVAPCDTKKGKKNDQMLGQANGLKERA